MMNNILGGLFGKVVDNAEGILDEIITTDEEREEAKAKIKQMLLDSEAKMQEEVTACLLYTSPSPRDRTRSRMPSSA